jgi:hypothetical protein
MWEILMLLVFMFFVLLIGGAIKRRNLRIHPNTSITCGGFGLKLSEVFFLLRSICFYYEGGDTVSYYECSLTFRNLLFKDLSDFWYVYISGGTEEVKSVFNSETGEPLWYIFKGDKTRFVTKLLVPFVLAGGGSYILTTVLVSIFTYGGLWKLYRFLSVISLISNAIWQ